MRVRSAGTIAGFLVCALFVACAPTRDSPEPVTYDIGDRNQVFIDGRYLDSASDVRISVTQRVKTYEQCLAGAGKRSDHNLSEPLQLAVVLFSSY